MLPTASPKRKKPQTDKKHLARVAALGCIICRGPATIHHIRHGQGMGQRASDHEAIGLCHYHHQGKEGIHTLGTKPWEKKYGTEVELLNRVHSELGVVKPVAVGHSASALERIVEGL